MPRPGTVPLAHVGRGPMSESLVLMTYICIYEIYIYIYIERERDMYIYIYMFVFLSGNNFYRIHPLPTWLIVC